MTDPSFLPFQNSLNQTSLFTYRIQYHFICCMILPRHPLHSSPYPHFKSIQSVNFLLSQCPCLATIESNWPHNCLNYFLFQCLTHSSPYPHFKSIQSVNFLLSQCPC